MLRCSVFVCNGKVPSLQAGPFIIAVQSSFLIGWQSDRWIDDWVMTEPQIDRWPMEDSWTVDCTILLWVIALLTFHRTVRWLDENCKSCVWSWVVGECFVWFSSKLWVSCWQNLSLCSIDCVWSNVSIPKRIGSGNVYSVVFANGQQLVDRVVDFMKTGSLQRGNKLYIHVFLNAYSIYLYMIEVNVHVCKYWHIHTRTLVQIYSKRFFGIPNSYRVRARACARKRPQNLILLRAHARARTQVKFTAGAMIQNTTFVCEIVPAF